MNFDHEGHARARAGLVLGMLILTLVPAATIVHGAGPDVTGVDTEITPPQPQRDEWFGGDVDVQAGVLVVAAPHRSPEAAFVFRLHDGAWRHETTFGNDAGASIGEAVAIEGDRVFVSDIEHDNSRGQVHVYRNAEGAWAEEARFTASDVAAPDHFGRVLAADGDVLVVGTPDQGDNGSAYVFRHGPAGWAEEAILRPDDLGFRPWFGADVSVSGDTIAAAAVRSGDGAVLLYGFVNGTWTEDARLAHPAGTTGTHFGDGVSLHGDTLVVGAPFENDVGAAYVYTRVNGTWQAPLRLAPAGNPAGASFGKSVATDGDLLAVGAPDEDDLRGAAYVYRARGNEWELVSRLTAASRDRYEFLGWSTAVDAGHDRVLAGEPGGLTPYSTWSRSTGIVHAYGVAEPVVSLDPPAPGHDGCVPLDARLHARASDRDGDVAALRTRVNGGAWSDVTGTRTNVSLPPGDNVTVDVETRDSLGQTASASWSGCVGIAPLVDATLEGPRGVDCRGRDTRVVVRVADPDDDLASLRTRFNEGAWQTWPPGKLRLTPPRGESVVLEAQITDSLGKTATTRVSFCHDPVPPAVEITRPGPAATVTPLGVVDPAVAFPPVNAFVGAPVTFEGTASDDRALTRVQAHVDGTPVVTEGTAAWRVTLELPPGRYVLRVDAEDAAGNLAHASRIIIVAGLPAH